MGLADRDLPYIDFKRFVTVRVAVILPLWSFAVDRIISLSVNIPNYGSSIKKLGGSDRTCFPLSLFSKCLVLTAAL